MGILDLIKDTSRGFLRDIYNQAPKLTEKIVYQIKLEVWKLEKKLIKDLTALFIFMLSFSAFILAALFFFVEYINLTKTLSFLIIGIILLIIGIFLKLMR